MNKFLLATIIASISTTTLAEPFAGLTGATGLAGASSSVVVTGGSTGSSGFSSAYSSSSIVVVNGQVKSYSVQTGGTGTGTAQATVIAPNFSASSFWPRR